MLIRAAFLAYLEGIAKLYSQEVVLHSGISTDDFRTPYRLAGDESFHASRAQLNHHEFKGLTACVSSAHQALNSFLSLDEATLQHLPCLAAVWTTYAAVVLIRIYRLVGVVMQSDHGWSQSELKVEYYITRLIERFSDSHLLEATAYARGYLQAFTKLRAWHLHKCGNASSSDLLASAQSKGETGESHRGISEAEDRPGASSNSEYDTAKEYTGDMLPCGEFGPWTLDPPFCDYISQEELDAFDFSLEEPMSIGWLGSLS